MIKDLGIDEHDCEGRTITLEFKKFYLICTYVPNASQKLRRLDYRQVTLPYLLVTCVNFVSFYHLPPNTISQYPYRVNSWDVALQNFIINLEKTGKPVIWCGDLNVAHKEIDIHDPEGKHINLTPL